MLLVVHKPTNTVPMLLHACGSNGGQESQVFTALRQKMDSRPPLTTDLSWVKELTILTWSNREWPTSLELAMDRNGLGGRYTVLGRQCVPWDWVKVKVSETAAYLRTVQTEYVLAMDAPDVIMLQPPEAILKAFKSIFPVDRMVFNAETHVWPTWLAANHDNKVADKFFAGTFRFLNGGVWISRTETAVKVLTAAEKVYPYLLQRMRQYFKTEEALVTEASGAANDDQGLIRVLWMQSLPEAELIHLDYQCQLALCVTRVPIHDLAILEMQPYTRRNTRGERT